MRMKAAITAKCLLRTLCEIPGLVGPGGLYVPQLFILLSPSGLITSVNSLEFVEFLSYLEPPNIRTNWLLKVMTLSRPGKIPHTILPVSPVFSLVLVLN